MNTLQRAALALLAIVAPHAWAHGGHGMPGEIHWHATDAAGLAVIAVGAVLAAWLAGRE